MGQKKIFLKIFMKNLLCVGCSKNRKKIKIFGFFDPIFLWANARNLKKKSKNLKRSHLFMLQSINKFLNLLYFLEN